ncbi:hypothetical protein ACQKFA_10430 [Streptomyces sp. CH6]|uniref:hypothetical protein n=1 Tax=Streptomyces sp. CH6 TaxID=3420320 RepID=UPI0004C55B28
MARHADLTVREAVTEVAARHTVAPARVAPPALLPDRTRHSTTRLAPAHQRPRRLRENPGAPHRVRSPGTSRAGTARTV